MPEETQSIFQFIDFAEFLKVRSQHYGAIKNRAYTSEQWAKRLGYQSPQSVSMVLSKQRLPSNDMVFRLAKDLELSDEERRYFELMVHLERLKAKGASVTPIVEEMEKLNPRLSQSMPLDLASFSYISDWYNLVIKQLVGLKAFKNDVTWIREKLRRKVSAAEANRALATLEKLGLIMKNPATGELLVVKESIHTESDRPSEAIKLHHEQMLDRAKESLREQSVLEREVTSMTLQFSKSMMTEAKEAIRAFNDEFEKKFFTQDGADVYQLNVQFFAHTH